MALCSGAQTWQQRSAIGAPRRCDKPADAVRLEYLFSRCQIGAANMR